MENWIDKCKLIELANKARLLAINEAIGNDTWQMSKLKPCLFNRNVDFYNLFYNRIVGRVLAPGVPGFGSKVRVWFRGSLGVAWYAALRMGWPLEASRSLFPDWPWLCDESSPHKRALHHPTLLVLTPSSSPIHWTWPWRPTRPNS